MAPPTQQYAPPQPKSGNGFAVTALVLGIIAILGCLIPIVNIFSAFLAVLALIFGVVLAAGVNAVDKSIAKSQEVQPLSGKMKTDVKDGDFTFMVNSSQCGLKTSGGSLPDVPQGQFCKINVKVTNHGVKAGTFDASQVKGVIGQTKYNAESGASISANANTDTFLTSINPGNSITANVMIDIPGGKTLDGVELHDSMLSGGVGVAVK